MNTRKLLLTLAVLTGLASAAFAQTQAAAATVARFSGNVIAVLPDGSSVAVTQGMQLPQGATITTGDKSDAYLVTHGDTTSVVTSNSEVQVAESSVTTEGGQVTKQTTTLDLKSGNLVAKLNPAKKSVNNYNVRTPKGVAAARGTIFTVSYKGGNYTIAVVNGVVTVTPPGVVAGASSVTVNAGQVTGVSAASGETLNGNLNNINNSQSKSNVNIRELLAVAVATVAVAAQNNIGGTTAADAAAVAQAVFTAVPGAAEQAGALIKQSNIANPPANPTAAAAVLDAVTTATPAAAQGAFTSGATTGTFTPNTQTTTTNPGSGDSNGANKVTTPQPIDPGTVSRSG